VVLYYHFPTFWMETMRLRQVESPVSEGGTGSTLTLLGVRVDGKSLQKERLLHKVFLALPAQSAGGTKDQLPGGRGSIKWNLNWDPRGEKL
jgi:hypothetical protein